MKLVIVGGVAGGASAATRARRLSEEAQIVLIERGSAISFANCGMPYYVGQEITTREKLLVAKPELLRDRFKIDVRTLTEVVAIDRATRTLRLRPALGGPESTESYDKLILSPGASPIRPAMPGIDHPCIFTLRTLNDMDRIRAVVDKGARRAVVIGAGFIGLEMTENFAHRGLDVDVIELQPQVLPTLDAEMTTPIVETLRGRGVKVHLSRSAKSFEVDGAGVQVILDGGQRLAADLVLLGIGVQPDNVLAVRAGLEIGVRGGNKTNAHLQTSDPDIYAVGDAIETVDFITGQPAQIPLAGPANRQGRIAADHIFGRHAVYRGTQGTAIVRVFETVAAMTGAAEKTLARLGTPFQKAYIHPAQHAGYYPGATPMTIKILFEPASGKILGAQAVGRDGVDKRIDVLAVAIQAGMTVFDLEEMELCYAPPFGSAKDPVNMAGFVASNLLRGEHPQIYAERFVPEATAGTYILDVRTPTEFDAGHIDHAVNIPVDQLRGRLDELPTDRPIHVYCQVGQRGYIATRILQQCGYQVVNLSGGFKTYTLHSKSAATAAKS
jgi:NADPH-dependent 2,4-dienoyl-CoA reductase/sulfur reductase-like enzyme/rhodanese-related sulfurtransferase